MVLKRILVGRRGKGLVWGFGQRAGRITKALILSRFR